MLTFYHGLIELRRRTPALAVGNLPLVSSTGDVLVYVRESGTTRVLVALNLGVEAREIQLYEPGRIVLSTDPNRTAQPVSATLELEGDEGVIVELNVLPRSKPGAS